jgi:hypothetical protein
LIPMSALHGAHIQPMSAPPSDWSAAAKPPPWNPHQKAAANAAALQGYNRPILNRLSRCDFSETQCEERLAGDTEVRRFFGVNNGEYLGFTTASARGCGAGRFGFGRQLERVLQFTHPGGFEFERRIAVVADMVETTGWLAGVKNILRPALRAGNGNGGKPHRSSQWRSATGAVKLDDFTPGPPLPSQ